jgi:hypothetical protein
MLMVVIVVVVVLLSWAVASSVPVPSSSDEVEPKRRGWKQALRSAAVMLSFFLDPTRREDVPGDGARRDDGAVRGDKVIDAVGPMGSPAQVPRSALGPALGAQRLRRWSAGREEGSSAASRRGGAAA